MNINFAKYGLMAMSGLGIGFTLFVFELPWWVGMPIGGYVGWHFDKILKAAAEGL